MSSSFTILMLGLLASCVVGWLSAPFSRGLQAEMGTASAVELASVAPSLGQGVSMAALGGYSALAANVFWIRVYQNWHLRDADGTLANMGLAVALNPNSEFFWTDGARIIANDMPVWEIGQERMEDLVSTESGRAIRLRYARRALDFLDQAPPRMAASVDLLREKGVISWQKLEDLEQAMVYFKQAAELPEAPYYLSRVYAELLVKTGRVAEARAFLIDHLAGLPDGDPRALKGLVASRIQELERLLAQP